MSRRSSPSSSTRFRSTTSYSAGAIPSGLTFRPPIATSAITRTLSSVDSGSGKTTAITSTGRELVTNPMPKTAISVITECLGERADYLLNFSSPKLSKERLHIPGPDLVEKVFFPTDRNNRVLINLQRILNHGRLGGTGYVSILPVDQGIEHSAGASFAKNPDYFDSENIVKLGIEGGCNAVASTFGVLGSVARRYAHRIPFLVKINHNELLTYPNKFDQILFGTLKCAAEMGAAAVGATIYFGSEESSRQIVEVSQAFAMAHELGLCTILWCYLRNKAFKLDKDYGFSADLTSQANYLGVTIQADIVKQKLPENNGGYKALNHGGTPYGKYDERMYSELSSDHPIDLCRYQVANCYMGRAGLINSGGASGDNDFADAIATAVINKRAGGTRSEERRVGKE